MWVFGSIYDRPCNAYTFPAMFPSASDSSSPPLPFQAVGLPLRSPRTSLVLAELARQRRGERRQRCLKRQQRRRAWARVIALGRRFFEAVCAPVLPGVSLPEARALLALGAGR